MGIDHTDHLSDVRNYRIPVMGALNVLTPAYYYYLSVINEYAKIYTPEARLTILHVRSPLTFLRARKTYPILIPSVLAPKARVRFQRGSQMASTVGP